MNDRECMIVKDLQPLYDEGLVSRETESYIKEHLQSCQVCAEYYIRQGEQIEVTPPLDAEEEEMLSRMTLGRIKRSQYGIRYFTIIFSMFVAVWVAVISEGFISTIPLTFIVPFALMLMFDEMWSVFTAGIVACVLLCGAKESIWMSIIYLPVILVSVSCGIGLAKVFKKLVRGGRSHEK